MRYLRWFVLITGGLNLLSGLIEDTFERVALGLILLAIISVGRCDTQV